MTYHEVLQAAEQELQNAQVPDAGLDAWYLMEYCCGMTRTDYLLRRMEQMPEESRSAYQELIGRRAERIPLQHITGEQEFMGLTFRVSKDVLIPRQDTEILVEQALKVCRPGMRVLDLCTGSGCIAISIASFCKECQVTAVDISDQALQVAAKNAETLGCAVTFQKSNLFEQVEDQFDLIVSNPPYIAAGEIEELMPEVRLHEPLLALDGGADGADFYRAIIMKSREYLRNGGWLMFEIGCEQGETVADLMRQHNYREVTVRKDLAGLDRVVTGRLNISEE